MLTKHKTLYAAMSFGALLASGAALAEPVPVHYIEAPVVGYEPQYATERIPVEREVCWQEHGYRRGHGSATGTIAGAIIGGVVGNQFGSGSGKRALTAAGAALGASIGHDASRHQRHRHPVRYERCEIQVDYESRQYLSGYSVRYRWRGAVHETFSPTEPGATIRLEVTARPVG